MNDIKERIEIEGRYERITKKAKISFDGKQLFVRIPKDISDFLEVKRGDTFKFIILAPLPSSKGKEIITLFELKEGKHGKKKRGERSHPAHRNL